MRDIKFRAFNGKSRVMEIVFRLVGKEYLQINTGLSIDNNLMQFTGLHDKNGKEIYEGDIVKFASDEYYSNDSFSMDELDFTGRVMQEHALWLANNDSDLSWLPLCDYVNGDMECEVIGNIHQNPELLEELA